MNQTTQPKHARGRLLGRGESAVAPIGLLLAGITIATLGAAAWWSSRSQQSLQAQASQERLEAVGALLGDQVAELIHLEELSRARMIVLETAQRAGFEACRVVLPDGTVVAAESPAAYTPVALPATWTGSAPAGGPGMTVIPIEIAGRGAAALHLREGATRPSEMLWQMQAGLAAIGVGGLFAVLLVYRHTRRRLSSLAMIGDAMMRRAAGETDPAVLRVQSTDDEGAAAWNALVEELSDRADARVLQRLEASAGAEAGDGRLGPMCDAMPQGLVLIGDELDIRYCNGAAAFYLNRSRADVMQSDVPSLIDEADVLACIREAASGGRRGLAPITVRRGDDEHGGILRFSVRPVHDEGGRAALVVIDDVTQQHVAEESRESFVAHVAHELRTPLTNILLWSEGVMDRESADAQATENALNAITQESKRLERVVQDMLSVSEIEAGRQSLQIDDVDLRELFEQLQRDYDAAAKDKHIELLFELPPKLPIMAADRDKVAIALHNLVGNAIKYTPVNGRVSVMVEMGEQGLSVEVADSGIGIAEGDLERIFDRFYRAKDERLAGVTGSGLGLAIARDFVRMHGGDIAASSELNQGSTFTLTLPERAAVA